MSPRIFLHIDMDAFYAAIEERIHPEYRNKPVVVGANPKNGRGRGVVSTCNYKARRFGIHSAMPISKAWNLCKEAVFTPVNYKLYNEVSINIMKILKSHTDRVLQVSIDEAYLEIDKSIKDYHRVEELAQTIKKEIMTKEGLTCSVGIAPSKLVAKIASDYCKPDGLKVVEEKNVKKFLSPLPVEKLLGIGKKTKTRLNAIGIRTIGELASYDTNILRKNFGVLGIAFHNMAQGADRSKLIDRRRPKSISREHTFEKDTSDKILILRNIYELSNKIIRDAKKKGFSIKTITVKIRYENFKTYSHSKTIPFPIQGDDRVKEICCKLVQPFLHSNKNIRLIGVKVSNLVQSGKQKSLVELIS